ncbi:MAG TPA: hypothetical protein PK760_00085 [Flavobacteriales bacterium]|nr:hypothetical protein [Flavobacteriales bacterium]
MRMWLVSILVLLATSTARAQDIEPIKGLYLGVGAGQDVGGIVGGRCSYWVASYAGFFAGGGWALVGPGYNLGVELRYPSKSKVSPFVVAMHGYNGVVQVKGKEELDKMFYGETVGVGLILQQRELRNYWRFSLNFPLNRQEMYDYFDGIKKNPKIVVTNEPLPFTIGIGFHFGLGSATFRRARRPSRSEALAPPGYRGAGCARGQHLLHRCDQRLVIEPAFCVEFVL